METPIQVTFRNMDRSSALEDRAKELARRLEQHCDHLMSCRVVIEAPHRRHNKGKLYRVAVDVRVPGRELVVKEKPEHNHAHEDPYVALRDAFNAMTRRLQDHVRKARGKVKRHEIFPHGRVTRLDRADGTGLIMTSDGRDIPFTRNSVVDADFDDLVLGDEVRFSEFDTGAGPSASTVRRIGKHHIVG